SPIQYPRLPCLGGGHLHIRTAHHNKWVASSQFQHHFLDSLSRADSHFNSCSFASRQRGRHYSRISQDSVHSLRADQQCLESSLGKPGPPEDVLNGQRTLRNNRGVLKGSNVPTHSR